jgi:hypothetical protein
VVLLSLLRIPFVDALVPLLQRPFALARQHLARLCILCSLWILFAVALTLLLRLPLALPRLRLARSHTQFSQLAPFGVVALS